jgi:predicted secreted hydrolase
MNRFLLCVLLLLLAPAAPLPGAELLRQTAEGFSVPQPGRAFVFPRDHGSHPDFKIEWWYITGHLFSEDGRRFGFQATFFRQANRQPGAEGAQFQHRQMYLAHMALLDARTGQFWHQERLNRAGWDAAAAEDTLDLRNGNWALKMVEPAQEKMKLTGTVAGEAAWDLELTPAKPLVFFGKEGISRKADAPTAASHYLTFTRLQVAGRLQLGQEALQVQGQAWMDHEISSSQLAPEQAGWDWAAIQLHDGREIMVYRMRRKDGTMDKYSTLAWIDAQAKVQHFGTDAFEWRELGHWQSPRTQARYPIRVGVVTTDPATGQRMELRLEPLADAQEQTGAMGGTAYWEGACRVLDASGKEVGSAFLELAGYSGDLARQFE